MRDTMFRCTASATSRGVQWLTGRSESSSGCSQAMATEGTKVNMTPSHPGEFIRTEVIEKLGLNVTKAAQILGVRQATLSALLNGNTAQMRVRDPRPTLRARDRLKVRQTERLIKRRRFICGEEYIQRWHHPRLV